jgi:CheY-like chemotaxis protein
LCCSAGPFELTCVGFQRRLRYFKKDWPSGMPYSKILVVDDFKEFRQCVCLLLQERAELQIVGEAADGLEAVHKAEGLQPDLILLDIGLPSLNGLEAAKTIREVAPQARILFVSQESSTEVVEQTLTIGAQGYVQKSYAHRDLLPAIDSVLTGKRFVSGALERVSDEPRFDIFAGPPDKDAMWLEAVTGLGKARDRMQTLASQFPGRYFVLSIYRHEVLAQIDTSENAVQDVLPKRTLGAA